MRRGTVAAVLSLLLVLAACGSETPVGASGLHGTELDPPFEVSSTPLTDDHGQPFSLRKDTDKPLTLVFYGYTHCPDICQTVMSNLASAMTRLDDQDRDRVDVVFVTTDPARDTQDVLQKYLSHFDPAFIGLTGDLSTIAAVAKPMGVGITQGDKLPSGGYDVTHGTTITGIDADDEGTVYWGEDTSSADFAADIHQLLDEGPMSPLLTTLTIPSPSSGVWYVGPFPLRGYALAIILGIVAAIWIGERRWVARGGRPGDIQDIAIWAVPFGLVGGRLYHVMTDHDLYFGAGMHPIEALYVWRGGLGVWGAIGLGAVGAVIAAKRKGIKLLPVLDAMAPGVLVAQALGRWGNWFNQELFGKPTDLPWALSVSDRTAVDLGYPPGTTFHPTFLYESLWCLAAFGILVWADRRFRLGHGRVVALYIMIYTLGRSWIEMLRIDNVELKDVGGFRFNVWTSLVLFVAALIWFVVSARRRPGREEQVYVAGRGPVAEDAAASVDATDAEEQTADEVAAEEPTADRGPEHS